MTKEKFNNYLDKITSETGFDLTKEQKAFAYQAAKKYHEEAIDTMQEYAQQIVLDKLPGDDWIKEMASRYDIEMQPTVVCSMKEYRDEMRTIATQRLTTRSEVEKPFRELLEGLLKHDYLPEYAHKEINELLKK